MSLTGGYEAAFEIREEVVRDIFFEAWRSGEIPHEIRATKDIPGHRVDTIVQILEANLETDLNLSFDTVLPNGLRISLPLNVQGTVQPAEAPSINPITFTAGLEITAPVEALPDTQGNPELVLNLAGLPDSQIRVIMPASPVIAVTQELIEDGLHQAYDDGLIPHTVPFPNPLNPATSMDIDIDDDDADPNRQIRFTLEEPPDHGTLTLPVFIHLLGGIEATVMVHNVKIIRAGDILTIRFADVTGADVEVVADPVVGGFIGLFKDSIAGMVRLYNEYSVFVPSNDTIAGFIRDGVKAELDTWGADGNGRLHIYTPNAVENTPIEIIEFVPVVKPGFLAILFNPMDGADPNSVENFIPDGKKFAQALAEPVVQRLIDQALQEKILDENGCGGWPCTFDHEIEGHEVTLTNRPNFTLHNGYILMTGSAEVAIDCWFDPDVDYEAKVNFYFETDADGNKIIRPNIYDADIDLSCLDWFLGFIILIYGWIALIVVNVVIESVGGEIMAAEGNKIAEGTKYLAGEIHGVGGVTTMLDQIDIRPEGIILSGGVFVVSSTFPLTIAPSESNAPYQGPAASPIWLDALHIYPNADYHWALGDGTYNHNAHISHTYEGDGIYLAELTVHAPEPYGVVTHHYARVKVDNVPPRVQAGPDMVANEGEVITFKGAFTDPEWMDTHEAVWQWGDNNMDRGVVVETNTKPQAEGTVTGSHAYCNNGVYSVTLRIRDNDGGVGKDTLRVTVKNVAPTVKTGGQIFAYHCVPVNLLAFFTDPGWCDTHKAIWDPGDCTPPMPATVREVNEPPLGYGLAVITHTYKTCGIFLAECRVIDSDGAAGQAFLTVRVITLLNGDFEAGFRNLLMGTVANHWEPYALGGAAASAPGVTEFGGAKGATFEAEEFVVHGGQRSQKITGAGENRLGIYQAMGANPHWDYQVSTWYHLDERGGGICRLGIDPEGGHDPNSNTISWVEGAEHRCWAQLLQRVTATGPAITIFLEVCTNSQGTAAYFDDVVLSPYPCPLQEPEKPDVPAPPQEVCVDWRDEEKPYEIGASHQKGSFSFQTAGGGQMRLLVWGVPPNQGKLGFPPQGIKIQLPIRANRVVAHVAFYAGGSIILKGFDEAGNNLGSAQTPSNQGVIHTLEITAAGMTSLFLGGGGNEAYLLDLCAYD